MSLQDDGADGGRGDLSGGPLPERQVECLVHIVGETLVILGLFVLLFVTGEVLHILDAPIWATRPVKIAEWMAFDIAAIRLVVGTLGVLLRDDVGKMKGWLERRRGDEEVTEGKRRRDD